MRITRSILSTCIASGLAATLWVSSGTAVAGRSRQAPATALKIIVLSGEDATNVVQTRTAVAPVVQVVDTNNQPVSGATVKFAIQGGRATFSGARTLTMTTDAAGRAATTSLTPTSTGTVRIAASASFHGHVATAVITETNFLTAAAATAAAAGTTVAAATASTAAGGAATGAAAGGAAAGAASGAGAGIGLSATTLGIVGGAIAGGTLATKELLGNASSYAGPLDLQVVQSSHSTRADGSEYGACTTTLGIVGTLEANVGDKDGGLAGEVHADWQINLRSSTCANPGTTNEKFTRTFDIVGTAANLQGTDSYSYGGGVTSLAFSGSLSGNVLAGTWSLGYNYVGAPQPDGSRYTQVWPLTPANVSLTKN